MKIKYHSFEEYIQINHQKELRNSVKNYIADNFSDLKLATFEVKHPKSFTVHEVEVEKNQFIKAINENEIHFELKVNAAVTIFQVIHSEKLSDEINCFLLIECTAELNDGLHEFEIIDVDSQSIRKHSADEVLTSDLIPYISKDRLDDVAVEFLKKYCPRALKRPMQLPVAEVITNMGLQLIDAHIVSDYSIHGETYFSDKDISIFDSETRSYVPLHVKKGTIIIEPFVVLDRNAGANNNAIVHECVHWYLHKMYFELQKLLGKDDHTTTLGSTPSLKEKKKWSSEDWMEWQANQLAPRILAPSANFEKMLSFYQDYYVTKFNFHDTELWQHIIEDLAAYFEISKASARQRAITLGHEEAKGVYDYVGRGYTTSGNYRQDTLRENQYYSVGLIDAIIESIVNPEFKKRVEQRKYVYIESRVCVNDPQYITTNEYGEMVLTEYAILHPEECFAIFDRTYKSVYSKDTRLVSANVLFKDANFSTSVIAKYADNNIQIEQRADQIIPNYQEETEVLQKMNGNLAHDLQVIIDWRHLSQTDLAADCDMDEHTIRRILKGETSTPSTDTIMRIVFATALPLRISHKLLADAGHILRESDQREILFERLLELGVYDAYTCSMVLAECKLDTLK